MLLALHVFWARREVTAVQSPLALAGMMTGWERGQRIVSWGMPPLLIPLRPVDWDASLLIQVFKFIWSFITNWLIKETFWPVQKSKANCRLIFFYPSTYLFCTINIKDMMWRLELNSFVQIMHACVCSNCDVILWLSAGWLQKRLYRLWHQHHCSGYKGIAEFWFQWCKTRFIWKISVWQLFADLGSQVHHSYVWMSPFEQFSHSLFVNVCHVENPFSGESERPPRVCVVKGACACFSDWNGESVQRWDTPTCCLLTL